MLGTAQMLAWASSYYLPAMLAAPMAGELSLSTTTVYAAFSGALIASAMVGPWAGQVIDRHGGRAVLVTTSLLFSSGLAILGLAQSLWPMVAAWLIIGIAMGSGLYEAAFSCLVSLYGRNARGAITGITLIAGFASTVGWPLSAWMETQFTWRGACFGWAAMHILIGLPLNAWLPQGSAATVSGFQTVDDQAQTSPSDSIQAPRQEGTMAILAFVFAATWFISTAMATHLPRILEAAGASLATAVAIGALIGPAQVAGRVLEFGFLRNIHPLLSARLAALAHPVGVAVLLATSPALAPVFAILHGAGNGILTIAKGTLPLALFGTQGYGARQGWLMLPARIAQALSPFLFGLALNAWGTNALLLSGAIGLAAFGALMLLRAQTPPRAQ
jgi:predicted MFS family arabinose efflux permease